MSEDYKFIELIEKKVLSFDEVCRFDDASLTENIQAVFAKDYLNPGIKVTTEDEAVTLGLELVVYYGTNIPRLCYDIQSKVKKYLEETTGIEVRAINIDIVGIERSRKSRSDE